MSEPLVIGLIRDGQRRLFGDRWSGVFLHRELLWGPDDFQAWVGELYELDEWEDCAAGVVVDFDRRRLLWTGAEECFPTPRVGAVYERLLRKAWEGFDVETLLDPSQLGAVAGEAADSQALIEQPFTFPTHWRPKTIQEAQDEAEDDWDDGAAAEGPEGSLRAWIAIVDEQGVVRHRQLDQLPTNVLTNPDDVLPQLLNLPAAAAPPERVVCEAMWIDVPKRQIGLWGNSWLHRELESVRAGWSDWEVIWAEQGYEQQCAACGPLGDPMSDAEAAASFLPMVLSTQRFDLNTVVGALGGQVKTTAVRVSGCLFAIVCLPMLIFGLLTSRWREVGISMVATAMIFIVIFKLIEWRVTRAWSPMLPRNDEVNQAAPACGPQEESERRVRIDKLLRETGLPPLSEIEPLFPEHGRMDQLLG